MGPGGLLESFKIGSGASKFDNPLALSNYMLLRTKEKMVLEAKLKDLQLVSSNTSTIFDNFKKTDENKSAEVANPDDLQPKVDVDLLKEVDEIRKDIDEAFVRLDRMLAMAKDREEVSDFPVAFVTNILYVCEKNGIKSLINHDAYLDILMKKQDYIHLEGIGHAAYALNSMGIYSPDVWNALSKQV